MELLYVIVGGLIGLIGGLGSSWLAHKLSVNESRRLDRLQAYAEWSASVIDALDAWTKLRFFDLSEKMKADSPQYKEDNFPSSVTGRTREELAATWLEKSTLLRIATSRLVLLEPKEDLASEVERLSNVSNSGKNHLEQLENEAQIERELKDFLRSVQAAYSKD